MECGHNIITHISDTLMVQSKFSSACCCWFLVLPCPRGLIVGPTSWLRSTHLRVRIVDEHCKNSNVAQGQKLKKSSHRLGCGVQLCTFFFFECSTCILEYVSHTYLYQGWLITLISVKEYYKLKDVSIHQVLLKWNIFAQNKLIKHIAVFE